MGNDDITYDLQMRWSKGDWHDVAGFVNFPSVSALVKFVIQKELNPQEFKDIRVIKRTETTQREDQVI